MHLDLKRGGAGCGEVGIESFRDLEIDGAAGSEIQLPFVLESETALRAEVGLFAGYMQRVKIDAAIGQGCVDTALAMQMNGGNSDCQLPEAGFSAQLFRAWRGGHRK